MLNPQGLGDPTFGGGTAVVTVDLGGFDLLDGIAVQPDGKILLAGSTDATGTEDMAVVRLNADGSLDNSFGQGGKVFIDLGGDDYAHAMALQPDGKIILAGRRTIGTTDDIATVRLQPNGLRDTTYGKDGVSIIDLGQNELIVSMALQPDGKIVLGGFSRDAIGRTDILVVRLLGDPPAVQTPAAPVATGGGGQGPAVVHAGVVAAVPTCEGHQATIVGTASADDLTGTNRADVIVALGGDDTIKGLGGGDIVCAGAGRDRVAGGSGSDHVSGQDGDDVISGGAGDDRLSGQAGSDKISGGDGSDAITGGAGPDTLSGQGGKDHISGGPGADAILGGAGADTLAGQAGNDQVIGGLGTDTVTGGAGKNTIHE
jgi:uncharacterized delta-60 repeat protein